MSGHGPFKDGNGRPCLMRALAYVARAICVGAMLMLFTAGLPGAALAQSSEEQGKLSVTLAPSALLADGETHEVLYVQLLGPDGSPRQASVPVRVFLASDGPEIADLPAEVIVEAASSYVSVPLSVTFKPGVVRLSAVANGYEDGEIELETFSRLGAKPPFTLDVALLPPTIYPGASGILAVSIVDGSGVPYLAPRDVEVVLTSSAPETIEVPRSLVIPRGDYSMIMEWTARKSGDVNITAQAQSVEAGDAWVSVTSGTEMGAPVRIKAYPLLPSLPATGYERDAVMLQAFDERQNPVEFPCTDVFVTSSAPQVVSLASVSAPSPCDAASAYLMYSVRTSQQPGSAMMSAAVPGLGPANIVLTSHGPVGPRLVLRHGPELPLGTDAVPATISIQIVDSKGVPVSLHGGFDATLVAQGADLPDSVGIPAGQSFVTIPSPHSSASGRISITAAAPGLQGATLSYETLMRDLDVILDVPRLIAGETVEIVARVSSADVPVANAEVSLDIIGPQSETLAAKTDEAGRAVFSFTPIAELDSISLSARSALAGYRSGGASAELTVSRAVGTGDTTPSRLPFILIFASIGLVLSAYLFYNSSVFRRVRAGAIRRTVRSFRPLG
ncbi:MAG: hypothetical protein IH861_12085 [Chloroflexi bacterium]|nr:hypothetical protein [Chloroflexota bacterium]